VDHEQQECHGNTAEVFHDSSSVNRFGVPDFNGPEDRDARNCQRSQIQTARNVLAESLALGDIRAAGIASTINKKTEKKLRRGKKKAREQTELAAVGQ
jgi:hypothetical protein